MQLREVGKPHSANQLKKVKSRKARKSKKAKLQKKKRKQFATPQPDPAKSNTIISKKNISTTLAS